MSPSDSEGNGAGSAVTDSASTLFAYTVRRDGRTIAVLNAYETATGVTVASEVFPITKPLAAASPLSGYGTTFSMNRT